MTNPFEQLRPLLPPDRFNAIPGEIEKAERQSIKVFGKRVLIILRAGKTSFAWNGKKLRKLPNGW